MAACFCAVLVLVNILSPFRARATAGALAAVAGVTVLGAYLMASGVYPYITEAGQSLSEWTSDNLQPLLDKYNAYLVSIGKSYQITLNGATPTVKGYMVQGAIVIANDIWNKLREFVQWIQSEYTLTDNQTGVHLGSSVAISNYLPSISSGTWAVISSQGYEFGYQGNGERPEQHCYIAVSSEIPSNVFKVAIVEGFLCIAAPDVSYYQRHYYRTLGGTSVYAATVSSRMDYNGMTYVFSGRIWHVANFTPLVPSYSTYQEFFDTFGADAPSAGMTVDTGTVAPLGTLPADTPWGGLAAEGTSNPVEAVEQGITGREKPVIRPVEVEIGTGTEVDSETGEITENPVVVTPEDVVPTVAALSPPASFISALQTTMTTKFPFCLPFDLFKILQAFYVAPEAPVFSLSFHDPFSNSDFSIRVDLSPWDEVAAVVRNFEAMILLAGFCLDFDKFNVIHLILGGLG